MEHLSSCDSLSSVRIVSSRLIHGITNHRGFFSMRIFSIFHREIIAIILDICPEKGLVVHVVIMF